MEFLDRYKYWILALLVLILFWRILSQNIILLIIICVVGYFIYRANQSPRLVTTVQEQYPQNYPTSFMPAGYGMPSYY